MTQAATAALTAGALPAFNEEDMLIPEFLGMVERAGLPDKESEIERLREEMDKIAQKIEVLPDAGPSSRELKKAMQSVHETLVWAWKGAVAPALAVLAYTAIDVPVKVIGTAIAMVALTVLALTKLFILISSKLMKHDVWQKASQTVWEAQSWTLFVVALGLHPKSSQAEIKAYRQLFSGTPVQEVARRFEEAKIKTIEIMMKSIYHLLLEHPSIKI